MKLLALETANEQCSVSIVNDTQELFFQLDERAKAQTQTILPMIEQGFAQTETTTADLTAVAFSRGPGSFSGVRINAAVAQALAWSHDLPVIPVSTLQALAQAAYRLAGLSAVTAVLDARMNEVYIASFQLDAEGIMQPVSEEQLLGYSDAAAVAQSPLVGSGSTLLQQEQTQYKDLSATAQDIATIARVLAQREAWVSAEYALPVYLRDNAWKKIPEQGKS
ncbi:tRNA (adenosine(37)-N6)-threonylcarbamoyltransferase complex dimerization subunit type 1 TsaB [Acinetobacter indicus]|jgi:tRNA threonylcarbamoyladenosine biosynthesis protein TsaB|uniref:tRNA (adenosine(37)-N6)-threonylcarbamoyltransferase complex dimerization subunit type 1 TsaB n=1 Tax=Acinetobacter TaxID=469 RepID=UPI001362ACAB|nr:MULTISPECIES: tRNA (adenosine(37)-N6)-threonylcarbamoyltransferase complex dimerization subunit type 1 TsaB [Acinetobacter]MDM1331290.1 tRNA (adenosine(37)-N6)-threonylcarbamoyltransferase complex dimerization subunit type 1 TsaB [Acinetobacter indicus]MDM1339671.1 tRNA (adenosine(37)-N6)-threonylcarbamoyltransferase complex dimerization subunit type 1 TsaB [Acinetobacter indicus]NOJ68387.1 tRNA (adenosine(37)-N6)-threonylcarbamoyltransferase complex dimerization subunit type 1 TsaB [Acinetob